MALATLLIVLLAVAADSEAQVRKCADLAEEIAAGMRNRNAGPFTLTIVRPADVGERRVVGSCDGSTRRIVYEPRGRGEIVDEAATRKPVAAPPSKPTPEPAREPAAPEPAPKPATSEPAPSRAVESARPAPPETPPAAPPATARVAPPATPPSPPAAPPATRAAPKTPPPTPPMGVTSAPAATDTLPVTPLEATGATRRMGRGQLESLRRLLVDSGADDRPTLDEFVKHLKIGNLPDLAYDGAVTDFVIAESDLANAPAPFSLLTRNGKVILAERSAWVMGTLPQQHEGLADLCLLVQDFPAPGANYSDWVAEFNGTRYVKTVREYKSKGCLDRIKIRIAR